MLLKREVIVTGDQLVDATSTVGAGRPGRGDQAQRARPATRCCASRSRTWASPMAVVFIEQTPREGRSSTARRSSARSRDQKVISEATIRGVFGNQFQHHRPLAGRGARPGAADALRRSWPRRSRSSTSASIGPSLGQENIDDGVRALVDRHARAVRVHDPLLPRVRRRGLDRAAGERRAADRAAVADEGRRCRCPASPASCSPSAWRWTPT